MLIYGVHWFFLAVLALEAASAVFAGDIVSGAVASSAVTHNASVLVAGVLVGGGMHATDTEAGHGGRQVQVGRDAQVPGVRVQDVKVVAGQTVLNHHGLQAVHQKLRCIALG